MVFIKVSPPSVFYLKNSSKSGTTESSVFCETLMNRSKKELPLFAFEQSNFPRKLSRQKLFIRLIKN
jgi:hypothetical protein